MMDLLGRLAYRWHFDLFDLHAAEPVSGYLFLLIAIYIGVVSLMSRLPNIRRLVAPAPGATPHYLDNIEGLRGILAFCVFVTHFFSIQQLLISGEFRFHDPAFMRVDTAGALAVAFFFMITGYLFWGKFLRGPVDVPRLYLGRIFRIAPLYLITATAALLLIVYSGGLPDDPPVVQANKILSLFSFGGHRFDFSHWVHLNIGMAWSLKWEFLFYALLPFLFTLRRLVGWPYHILFFAFLHFWTLDNYFLMFIWAGTVIAELPAQFEKLPARTALWIDRSLALVAPFMFVFVFLRGEFWYSPIQMVFIAVIFTALVRRASFFGLLRLPALQIAGKVSYSTYMIHGCILHLLILLAGPYVDLAGLTVNESLAACALVMPLVFIASVYSYHFIERPCMDKGFIERIHQRTFAKEKTL